MAQAILKSGDHTLVQLSRALAPVMRVLGDLEHDLLASRLAAVRIEAPVFVTGLARAGTTMMLTLLSQAAGVATHRYRDFPFLFVPVAWNWLQDWLGAEPGDPVERPHRDRIRITKESAEAFEEPLWQSFFPGAHDAAQFHVLGAQTNNRAFEEAFRAHLRKILWLRNGRRYVSKGNYNVARIEYLARLFPDARFIVPVRHPVEHVRSLVEQHALFLRYAKKDRRVANYLAAAGHYEFGPQRRPLNLDAARLTEIQAAWTAGDEWRGYARQWAQVYAHVDRLRATHRLLVVRYEEACAAPSALAERLLAFCDLADPAGSVAAAAATLAAPAKARVDHRTVWEEAGPVAARFGYVPE